MDNQDKLYNQIKSAANNAESKEFPSMDKVWNRVEEKLDKKVMVKQTSNWKKIAVAASILLVVSVAYQYYKSDEVIITPPNQVVVNDEVKIVNPDTLSEKNIIVNNETTNPLIKENADAILKSQIQLPTPVALNEVEKVDDLEDKVSSPEVGEITNEKVSKEKNYANSASSMNAGKWMGSRKYDAVSVQHIPEEVIANTKKDEEKAKPKKQEQLLVIDDEISKKEASSLDQDEIESLVELKEPLYIINGVNYSEEELFGLYPTSPYAPLKDQKIETISILQDEKAVSIYGEKGKKGVVIITTKNGKPTTKKTK